MSLIAVSSSVQTILASLPPGRDNLIAILQEIQEHDGYVSEHAVGALAAASGVSANEIYGVASFYSQFRFRPPAKNTIHVCQGTACHVRGAADLLGDFEERLAIRAGEITPDQKFGLERVACVGCCARAPVVLVNGAVRADMKRKMVRSVLAQFGHRAPVKKS